MIVTPTNKSVTELKGLHLYHADMSNCSMRVRMTLTEKNLPWICRKAAYVSVDVGRSHKLCPARQRW